MPEVTERFLAVVRAGEWESYDALAGERLTDGTPVEVQWPDGERSRHKVKVRGWTENVSEQGQMHGTNVARLRAGIVVEIHGAARRVNLRGLMARRLTEREIEEGSVLP